MRGWRARGSAQPTGAGSRASLASSSVTIRSCSLEVAPGRPRAPTAPHEEDEDGEDELPARHTPHQRFHSPGAVFCAGTSFCSATRRLARFCEWTPTLDAISDWLTGWPF